MTEMKTYQRSGNEFVNYYVIRQEERAPGQWDGEWHLSVSRKRFISWRQTARYVTGALRYRQQSCAFQSCFRQIIRHETVKLIPSFREHHKHEFCSESCSVKVKDPNIEAVSRTLALYLMSVYIQWLWYPKFSFCPYKNSGSLDLVLEVKKVRETSMAPINIW